MGTSVPQYLNGLLADVAHVRDPAERLRAIRELRGGVALLDGRLRDCTRAAIAELRTADPPLTWQAIGDLLGVSAQRAEKFART